MNFFFKVLLIALFVAPISTAIAQKKNALGVRAYASVSGSGHGLSFSPSVFFRHNRALVSAGPLVNANGSEVCGIEGSYEYALTGACRKIPVNYYNDRLELFAFGSVLYRPCSSLSRSAIAMEQKAEMRSNPYADLKVRTAEAYIGFGLKLTLLKKLQWSNSIGLGGYVSPDSPAEIYRPQSAVCLLLRSGLYYSFR